MLGIMVGVSPNLVVAAWFVHHVSETRRRLGR